MAGMASISNTSSQETSKDAMTLLSIINDNEHWNRLGIPERDISVCFEMSHLCGYGFAQPQDGALPFSPRRFKAALAELADGDMPVSKRGDRWFMVNSPGLATAEDNNGMRHCARRLCKVEVKRANAVYCSERCRDRDRRYGPKTGRVATKNPGNNRSSEGVQKPGNRCQATPVAIRPKQARKRPLVASP